jgi:hypothetical protein
MTHYDDLVRDLVYENRVTRNGVVGTITQVYHNFAVWSPLDWSNGDVACPIDNENAHEFTRLPEPPMTNA